MITLQGTNTSHLGKGKSSSNNALVGDMLVPRRVRFWFPQDIFFLFIKTTNFLLFITVPHRFDEHTVSQEIYIKIDFFLDNGCSTKLGGGNSNIHAAPRQGPPAPRSQGVISASVVVAPGQIFYATIIQKPCIYRNFCAFRRKNAGIYDVFATSRTKLAQNTAIYSVF